MSQNWSADTTGFLRRTLGCEMRQLGRLALTDAGRAVLRALLLIVLSDVWDRIPQLEPAMQFSAMIAAALRRLGAEHLKAEFSDA
jgi:hypothetical protein